MIKPVTTKNTVNAAIDNIGQYIARHLQVGDVLPSERELAERLCISRNITREALQHYRTLGIIESKPKVGATVANLLPVNPYAGYMPFLSLMEHGMKDLAQLRLILELGTVEFAIGNISAGNIALLREKCSKMQALQQKLSDGDTLVLPELAQYDLDFHSSIMKLSGNKLVESLIPLVVEFFSKRLAEYPGGLATIAQTDGIQEHVLLVDALEAKDLPAARKLIRSHLQIYINSNREDQ